MPKLCMMLLRRAIILLIKKTPQILVSTNALVYYMINPGHLGLLVKKKHMFELVDRDKRSLWGDFLLNWGTTGL